MTIRLTAAARACLLDRTQPGSLAHDVLLGAPVIRRTGDPLSGFYEVNCSDTDCQELIRIASEYCPDALGEIEAEISRQNRA
ncbi:MAG TPA: hypothetical protein VGL70_12980 [Candidatus Binatia bacterium]